MKIYLMKILFPVLIFMVFIQPAISQVNNIAVPGNADKIHFSVISSTSVTFDWVGTTDIISIGTKPKKLIKTVRGSNPSFLPVTSPWISDPGPYWEAKLTGLKQNTTYYYAVGNAGINKFRTPPAPGSGGFRVCLTSDIHESSKECVAMFSQIAGLKPDLVLTTGDVTGAGPDGQQEVSRRFHDAMAWSLNAAWMPAWGNHDWEYTDKDDLRTLKGRFDIPNPGTISDSPAISCCGEDWGWFDYGNTRFISYPEPWSSASWIEWETQVKPVLDAAQKNPEIKFIVTFGHRSASTSTNHRSPGDTRIKTLLDCFHTTYSKYVLDLSGHNHQYERYLLKTGMTYVVNSSTGSYYHEGWDNPVKPENCAFRAIHYGIIVLDFTANSIKGKFVCSAGTTQTGPDYKPLEEPLCDEPGSIIDSFTIK
jgi:hypothetical protein